MVRHHGLQIAFESAVFATVGPPLAEQGSVAMLILFNSVRADLISDILALLTAFGSAMCAQAWSEPHIHLRRGTIIQFQHLHFIRHLLIAHLSSIRQSVGGQGGHGKKVRDADEKARMLQPSCEDCAENVWTGRLTGLEMTPWSTGLIHESRNRTATELAAR